MGYTKRGQVCWDCGRNIHVCVCGGSGSRSTSTSIGTGSFVQQKENLETNFVVGDFVSYPYLSDRAVGVVKDITDTTIFVEKETGYLESFDSDEELELIYSAKSTSFGEEFRVGAIVKYIKFNFYNPKLAPFGEIVDVSEDRKKLKVKWSPQQKYIPAYGELKIDELKPVMEFKTDFVKVVCNSENAMFDETFLTSKGMIIKGRGRVGQLVDVSADRKEILVRWKEAGLYPFPEDKEPVKFTFLENMAGEHDYKVSSTLEQWIKEEEEIQAKIDEENNYFYMDVDVEEEY